MLVGRLLHFPNLTEEILKNQLKGPVEVFFSGKVQVYLAA